MLTREQILQARHQGILFKLTNNLLNGGDDSAVFVNDNRVYKVYDHNLVNELAQEDMLQYEAKMLNYLQCPYMPQVYESYNEYMIMEYAKGYTLEEYQEEYGTNEGDLPYWIVAQIKEVLNWIQSKGIYPNEFEPRHIIINTETQCIKIIDVMMYERKQLTESEKHRIYQELFK